VPLPTRKNSDWMPAMGGRAPAVPVMAVDGAESAAIAELAAECGAPLPAGVDPVKDPDRTSVGDAPKSRVDDAGVGSTCSPAVFDRSVEVEPVTVDVIASDDSGFPEPLLPVEGRLVRGVDSSSVRPETNPEAPDVLVVDPDPGARVLPVRPTRAPRVDCGPAPPVAADWLGEDGPAPGADDTDPSDPDDSPGAASATGDSAAMAMPTPKAAAKAPMRPTWRPYAEWFVVACELAVSMMNPFEIGTLEQEHDAPSPCPWVR
jgi:hypothetical protein